MSPASAVQWSGPWAWLKSRRRPRYQENANGWTSVPRVEGKERVSANPPESWKRLLWMLEDAQRYRSKENFVGSGIGVCALSLVYMEKAVNQPQLANWRSDPGVQLPFRTLNLKTYLGSSKTRSRTSSLVHTLTKLTLPYLRDTRRASGDVGSFDQQLAGEQDKYFFY